MVHRIAGSAPAAKRGMVGATILATLLDEIVSGRWPEASVLPSEAALSRRFGVSRSALREAVRHLVAHGLVEARTRAGTIVLSRSLWNLLDPIVLAAQLRVATDASAVEELREALFLLMPRAAALAAERASAAEVATLERGLAAASNGSGDSAFHAALFAATRNWVFRQLGNMVGMALTGDAGGTLAVEREKIERWRKALFDAVRQQKAEDARAAMKKMVVLYREALRPGGVKSPAKPVCRPPNPKAG